MPSAFRDRRAGAAAALLAVALAGAAGCGPERAPADTVTLAVLADVTGFFPNPPIVAEGFTLAVNEQVYEGLVQRGRGGSLEPALAEHWTSPDDRTTVFRLRSGLRFSDGTRLTAADVVASFQAMQRRGWINHEALQAVESVRAVDDTHVELRCGRPELLLLSRLPSVYVLPRVAVENTPVPVVGTGPYRLESWTPGQEIALVRNPYYRGPPAGFARARFVVVPDPRQRLGQVIDGRADVADHVPLDVVEELEQRPELRVFSGSGSRVLFLRLRNHLPPFDDPRVRRALDLALDRQEIVARVFHGRAQVASQLVPRGIVGFDPGLPLTSADRPAARRLLAEAGYAQGLALRLDGPRNRYEMDLPLLREVARQLAGVGVAVSVNALDKAAFFARLDAADTSFFLAGWESTTGEAGDALHALFHPHQVPGQGGTPPPADAELVRLIEASHRAIRAEERAALLQAAVRRVAELHVVLPLVVQPETLVVSRRLVWTPPVDYRLRLQDLSPAPYGTGSR